MQISQYLLTCVTNSLDELPEDLTPATVEQTANVLQDVCAEVVAYLIDAGSERDAVNESEDLHKALVKELTEWAEG